jgi:hypothetical protein
MRSDFSDLSAEVAKAVMRRIDSARLAGFRSVKILGAWRQRRLCIVGLEPSAAVVDGARGNPEALSLTVSANCTVSDLMVASGRFGKFTEEIWRQSARSREDHVVSQTDGHKHIVPRFDHQARCGHVSGRWLEENEWQAISHLVQPCPRCIFLMHFADLGGS